MAFTKTSKITTPTWSAISKVTTPIWSVIAAVTTPIWSLADGWLHENIDTKHEDLNVLKFEDMH